MEKERRPYHRFCDCALHKLKSSGGGGGNGDGNIGSACLRRSVTFPGDKKAAAKLMNHRGRLSLAHWVERTKKRAGGGDKMGTNFLIED
ncbi:unnamed protein product [Linum tenue]|uniref:Uncharacterized protein n=1 Tax=Linum tenue TaxID=586396 RepID=A0AAV0QAF5_9ROSI|nr:unnamed protein product [Linum tenue]